MGNVHRRLLFALTAPDYNVQDPRAPPSYQIFKGRHVKTQTTRGLALREAYNIVDNSKNVVFKALECVDLSVRPTGLLGYVEFECRELRGSGLLRIKIYDYYGNEIITSFRNGRIINMIYISTRQCIGTLQERNTHGTKGSFPQDLDLKLKACILFAAALTARYCYHSSD